MDYIFYRVYLRYQEKDGSGRALSIVYFIVNSLFLFAFVFAVFNKMFAFEEPWKKKALYSIYILATILFWGYKYGRVNKIKMILEKYKNNSYNRKIAAGWFFVIPFVSIVVGILIMIISIKVLKEYDLVGVLNF